MDVSNLETVPVRPADAIIPHPASNAGSFAWIAWAGYIVFDVLGRWRLSLLSGALIMGVIVAIEYRHRAVKIPDATSLGFFAVMLAVTMIFGNWLIADYNVLIVWAAFAIVFWMSIAVGAPFSLQYAREMAPVEAWGQRIFIQANYRISLLWALIATANSILGIAMHFSSRPLLVGGVLPALLMVFGFVAGGWYAKRVAAQRGPVAAAG